MKKSFRTQLFNLMFPAVIFGSITGVLTSLVVLLYKVCAKYIISFSETGYHYIRLHLYWAIPALVGMLAFAFLLARIYKRNPNLRGGGIPTSIGILRGVIPAKWLSNLVGIFLLSLGTFLFGVPLGNEGPAVQMGTAIGRGSVFSFAKKHRAWDRYAMTGGACAGFATATGAPISGILFAIEEAHGRISPMIIIVSAVSVLFSRITTELLAPVLGVSVNLFPSLELPALSLKDLWIPALVGIIVGFFAVLFLNYYRAINAFFSKKLAKIPQIWRIFAIFALTLLFGLFSLSFVSTGHELILELFEGKIAIYMLLLILLVRSTLTLSASVTGVTGGMFVPILALGAVLSSALGKALQLLFDLPQEYYMVILVLGITACISGMMKTPLIAILFSIEALSCYENILYVIIAAAFAFIIPELFGAVSINDSVLERRVESQNEQRGKQPKVIDTFVTVQKGAFAVGKQIRDIFWPANLFVLSLKHDQLHGAEVDEHGGKEICEGDILHVRYSTYDESATKEELTAIVGEQAYFESETDII